MIIRHQSQILLERRPPAGIWGGLWCLPQIDLADAIAWPNTMNDTWLITAQNLGQIISYRMLPEYVHTFTHFRLRLLPLIIEIDKTKTTQRARQNTTCYTKNSEKDHLPTPYLTNAVDCEMASPQWFSPTERTSIGMPAPAVRLLQALA